MIVGLIADSHDRVPAITELVRRMQERGVGMVLHAGDHCSPFSLVPYRDAAMALAGIFGRNDGDREGLKASASRGMGMELYESPHSIEVGGHRILLVHDIADVNDRSIESHEFVVHGNLHRQELSTQGSTTIVNPGEACGWLGGVPSAALLDLDSGGVEFIQLTDPHWNEWRG